MTEKLLHGTLSLNTNKQTAILLLYTGSYKNTWAAQFVLFAKMHTEWNGCDWKFRHDRNCSTVRHHEACQVMPNSYPEWRNFSSHRTTIMDSFSCVLFLLQPDLSLNMLKYIILQSRTVQFLSATLTAKRLVVNDVKTDVKKTSWRHARESSYIPVSKTTFSCIPDRDFRELDRG